jgi:transcriptional regulator with XRE-family HTH domain
MNLRDLRKSKGVTVAEVARQIGTTVQGVYRIEYTGRTMTTTLAAYAGAIGADWSEVCRACKETMDRPLSRTEKLQQKVSLPA